MARILIVDDAKVSRLTVGYILRDDGHKVLEAANGQEAVEMAVTHSPDCIILDLIMPGMNGLDVLTAVKQKGVVAPVIVLTADIQETTRAKCLELGAVAFINKFPDEDELKTKVQEVIGSEWSAG